MTTGLESFAGSVAATGLAGTIAAGGGAGAQCTSLYCVAGGQAAATNSAALTTILGSSFFTVAAVPTTLTLLTALALSRMGATPKTKKVAKTASGQFTAQPSAAMAKPTKKRGGMSANSSRRATVLSSVKPPRNPRDTQRAERTPPPAPRLGALHENNDHDPHTPQAQVYDPESQAGKPSVMQLRSLKITQYPTAAAADDDAAADDAAADAAAADAAAADAAAAAVPLPSVLLRLKPDGMSTAEFLERNNSPAGRVRGNVDGRRSRARRGQARRGASQ